MNTGSNRLMRGVQGPAHALWESSTVIHPSASDNQWERQSPSEKSSPVQYQLKGWILKGLARSEGSWIVHGTRGDNAASGMVLPDGTTSSAPWPDHVNQQPADFRVSGQKVERYTDGIWKTVVQRPQVIRAWAVDTEHGIIGLALDDGRVERIDAITGSPIWDEPGPRLPVAMFMATSGIGVATADGSIWVWDAPPPTAIR